MLEGCYIRSGCYQLSPKSTSYCVQPAQVSKVLHALLGLQTLGVLGRSGLFEAPPISIIKTPPHYLSRKLVVNSKTNIRNSFVTNSIFMPKELSLDDRGGLERSRPSYRLSGMLPALGEYYASFYCIMHNVRMFQGLLGLIFL